VHQMHGAMTKSGYEVASVIGSNRHNLREVDGAASITQLACHSRRLAVQFWLTGAERAGNRLIDARIRTIEQDGRMAPFPRRVPGRNHSAVRLYPGQAAPACADIGAEE